jgi:cytochrome c-type biogenesis protein CcmH/NrfF
MKILNMFLCSLLVLFSVGTSFAYTDTELKNKTEAYERVLSSKYEVKIAKFSQRTLEKISTLIVERLLKVEDNPDMEDIKKLKTVALYNALKNIVDNYYDVTDELEDVINISVLNVTIIDDKRCKNCQTEEIIEQLKRVSVLADALFITKDFSDE